MLVFEASSEIFFLLLNENICYDPTIIPPERDGSKDWSQHIF